MRKFAEFWSGANCVKSESILQNLMLQNHYYDEMFREWSRDFVDLRSHRSRKCCRLTVNLQKSASMMMMTRDNDDDDDDQIQ